MYIMIAYVIGIFPYYKREFEKVKKRENEIIESRWLRFFGIGESSLSPATRDTGPYPGFCQALRTAGGQTAPQGEI